VVRPGRHPNRRGAQAGHSLSWQGARRQNTGDLWRVKLESNDCDFHLEISAPGQLKTANRIIVELPQGPLFLATRQKLIDELIANGYDPAVDKPLDLDEPLRIKVIGHRTALACPRESWGPFRTDFALVGRDRFPKMRQCHLRYIVLCTHCT
jgi:hypothetical protein